MIQAKRILGMIMIIAVLVSLGVMPMGAPVQAATEQVFTDVFDMDNWTAGINLGESDDTLSYGHDDNKKAGIQYHCTVTATGGERGNALKWTTISAGSWYCMSLHCAADPAAITDWTDAKELWYYTDVSRYSSSSVGLNFFFEDGATVWYTATGSTVHLYDMNTQTWSTVTVGSISGVCGYVPLPAGFTGWVRMTLDTDSFANPTWAAQRDSINLATISELSIGFQMSAEHVNKSAYVDSFCITTKSWTETDGLPSDDPDRSAGAEESLVYTDVLDMDAWNVGVNLGESNDTLGYGRDDNKKAGVLYHCSVSDTGGERGNALKWTTVQSGGWYCISPYFASDITSVSDWTGAKELWYYVDISQYSTTSIGLNFAFNDNAAVWYARPGGTAYLHSSDGKSCSKVTIANIANNCGYIPLPAGFTGWVRMPLDGNTFDNPTWGAQVDSMNLGSIVRVSFGFEMKAETVGKSAYIDSFCVANKVWTETDPLPSDIADRTKPAEEQEKEEFIDDYVGPLGINYDRENAVAYLYATFRDDSVDGEKLFYSLSTDGLHFQTINNGQAVYCSPVGDQSIRDPYIFEAQEGGFYMISSDVRSSDDWLGHTMVIFYSEDLIHWENVSLIDVHDYESTKEDLKAWAPEAIWDPEKQMYMLYWGRETTGQMMSLWYAYTKDFTKLETEPACLYAHESLPIYEPNIYYYEGVYHLYFSCQQINRGSVYMVESNHASGPYINRTGILNVDGIPSEGPNLFKVIGQDKWMQMSDGYLNGIISLRQTTDFENLEPLRVDVDYSFEGPARSGSIFQITQAEYDALMAAFPNDPVPAKPNTEQEVYGFTGVPVGTDFVSDRTYGYSGESDGVVGTHFTAQIAESDGNRFLKWTTTETGEALSVHSNARLVLKPGADQTAKTDWTGAEELAFYVDASAYGDGTAAPAIGLRLTTADGSHWAPTVKAYLCAEGQDNWTAKFVNKKTICLPVGFKGWIRIPLDADMWAQAWNGSATGTFPADPQITQIWVIAGGNENNASFVNTSVIFDSFTVLQSVSEIVEWNLTLGDNIGANFYVKVADAANTQVKITVAGKTTEVKASDVTPDADGYYVFSADVAAAQMTDTITVELVVNGETVDSGEYTVRQYADVILAGDYDDVTKNLVKAMLNYGGKAQTYFGYNTDTPADDGITVTETDIPADVEAMSVSGKADGVSYYGATLVFQSKTAVRFYFTGDVTGCTFKVGEDTLTPVQKDGRWYVEIAQINPQDLDKAITLSVNGTLTVTYSPLNYMVRMYNGNGSDTLKTLLKALYTYHLAAVEYAK